MIRLARYGDIPELVAMGHRFFNESGYDDITECDSETLVTLFNGMIESDTGYILVVDDDGLQGMAGALLFPFFFNQNHLAGQELFWFINPEYRGKDAGKKLLEGLEIEAKARGAQSFIMMALQKLNPGFVGKIYESHGYRRSENNYIRRL